MPRQRRRIGIRYRLAVLLQQRLRLGRSCGSVAIDCGETCRRVHSNHEETNRLSLFSKQVITFFHSYTALFGLGGPVVRYFPDLLFCVECLLSEVGWVDGEERIIETGWPTDAVSRRQSPLWKHRNESGSGVDDGQ